MNFCTCLLLFALALPSVASSQPTEAITYFNKANTSYEEGKFSHAVELYEKALHLGLRNGHLFYNLGNAEYRLGMVGKAVAAYRKALLDIPSDPDVLANLTLARKLVKQRIEDSTHGIVDIGFLAIAGKFLNRFELKLAFLAANCLFWSFLVVAARYKSGGSQIAVVISLLLMVMFAIPLYTLSGESGVIIAKEVKVYSGNGESFQVIFVLTEGVELDVGEHRLGWSQVFLGEGRKGWVKDSDLDLIRL